MTTLSIRDFRSNMASSFNKVDHGENVLIRRRNEIYALVKIGAEDLTITPVLQQRIDEVHQALCQGECTICATHDELDSFLNSL